MVKSLFKCILVLSIFVFLFALNFLGIHTEWVDYYALGRFRIIAHSIVKDNQYRTELEYGVITYRVNFPYLYVRGESGYTRILLTPIITDILKIPDRMFYQTHEAGYYDSIQRLQNIYGNSIKFKDNLDELDEIDKNIFDSLRE